MVLDLMVDCTRGLLRWPGTAGSVLRSLMETEGLVDILRVLNPQEREYTFRSSADDSSSRLDFWLGSRDVLG